MRNIDRASLRFVLRLHSVIIFFFLSLLLSFFLLLFSIKPMRKLFLYGLSLYVRATTTNPRSFDAVAQIKLAIDIMHTIKEKGRITTTITTATSTVTVRNEKKKKIRKRK